MQPEERDAAYLWDMLDAARAVREFISFRTYIVGQSAAGEDKIEIVKGRSGFFQIRFLHAEKVGHFPAQRNNVQCIFEGAYSGKVGGYFL